MVPTFFSSVVPIFSLIPFPFYLKQKLHEVCQASNPLTQGRSFAFLRIYFCSIYQSKLDANFCHGNFLHWASKAFAMDFAWMVEFLKGMVKPLFATVVVLMAVGLSFAQKLGLESEMIYSIARAFLQLSVIGFVLQFIFTQKNVAWIVLAYLFMVCLSFPLHICSHQYFMVFC